MKTYNERYETAKQIEKEIRNGKTPVIIINGRKSDIKINSLYSIEVYANSWDDGYSVYMEYKNVYGEYKSIRRENVEEITTLTV